MIVMITNAYAVIIKNITMRSITITKAQTTIIKPILIIVDTIRFIVFTKFYFTIFSALEIIIFITITNFHATIINKVDTLNY